LMLRSAPALIPPLLCLAAGALMGMSSLAVVGNSLLLQLECREMRVSSPSSEVQGVRDLTGTSTAIAGTAGGGAAAA
jgi:hypothetical protein